MRQRLITVPVSKEAEALLDYDNAKSEDLIETSLTDDEFLLLWNKGFFNRINHLANVNIDDYEDECIILMNDLIKVYNNELFNDDNYDKNISEKIKVIKMLFLKAIEAGTGVYFFF